MGEHRYFGDLVREVFSPLPSVWKWKLVILGLAVVLIQISERSLGDIWLTSFQVRSSLFAYTTFVTIILFAVVLQFLILKYISRLKGSAGLNTRLNKVLYYAAISVQVLVILIICYSIVEVGVYSYYSTAAIISVLVATYGTSFIFLTILGRKLVNSFGSSRNKVVLLYSASVLCLALNMLINLSYFEMVLSGRPQFISAARDPYASFTNVAVPNLLISSYQLIGTFSFMITWVSTALLLSRYSRTMGRVKYWILVGIPLAYFLGQFLPYVVGPRLDDLRMSDPRLYSIVYNTLVNSVRSAGGVLFGVAFFALAKEIKNEIFQRYLIVSGVGIMLIFSSLNSTSLTKPPYPPFGIASISFLGLASYLLLSGMSSAAEYVARDATLRRSIQKCLQNFDLIGAMGLHQIEDSLSKKVDSLMKTMGSQFDETKIPELKEDEIKMYISEAIKEREESSRKEGKSKSNSTETDVVQG